MNILEFLENKMVEVSNKRHNLNNFSYIGEKHDILNRIGELVIKAIIRNERGNIKQYIQENYSTSLNKLSLVRNCLHSIFNVGDDDFIVYNAVELVEHTVYLPDFLNEFNKECEKVFKDIESHTLKLF